MIIALFSVVLVWCTAWAPSEDAIEDDGMVDDAVDDAADGNAGVDAGIINEGETLKLVGTEPFWGVEITTDSITWSAPAMEGEWIIENVYPGLVVSEQESFTTYRDAESTIVAIVSEGDQPCSDGMSNISYTYNVTVEYQGETYEGCAEVENE